MNDEVKQGIERIRGIGTKYTFEGEYIADFIERLDKVIEIKGINIEGVKLQLLVGNLKVSTRDELLSVVTRASLHNISAAGYEDTQYGKVLYFEYIMPPW
ncbi:MAG: hypothetical protein NWE89_12835 [Candidatus Bathyarchaeota archaeon]|nr:hypothetical protein [Candidatus Bathyarchaeota archaeon]